MASYLPELYCHSSPKAPTHMSDDAHSVLRSDTASPVSPTRDRLRTIRQATPPVEQLTSSATIADWPTMYSASGQDGQSLAWQTVLKGTLQDDMQVLPCGAGKWCRRKQMFKVIGDDCTSLEPSASTPASLDGTTCPESTIYTLVFPCAALCI
jgi:hypothetical protein